MIRDFKDSVNRAPRGNLSLSNAGNDEWIYRVGTWHGRFYGQSAIVRIFTWPQSEKMAAGTEMQVAWCGLSLSRRWPHTFTDRKLSQLAREFCEDAADGQVGAGK